MKNEWTKEEWRRKSVVISVHTTTSGPGHDLRDYLLKREVGKLLFIAHPLLYFKENIIYPSRYEFYTYGKKVREGTARHYVLPEYVLYAKDILLTLYWTMRIIGKQDIFVGIGNLNAFSGLILKVLKFTKVLIYYVIDFVPERFANPLFNSIYHFIEKNCAQYASVTWNLSPRMITAREKKWNMKFSHQIIVPHGVHFSRIRRVSFENIHHHEIIFMGSLLEKQGVQLVIEALPDVKKKLADVHFTIIGKGPYEFALKELVIKRGLTSSVDFLGYINSHSDVENRIAKSAIAVALYEKHSDEFSYYADPGKIKNYLGAGVPVLMTDVPYIAQQLVQKRCGLIISYDIRRLAEALINFLSDQKMQKEYRQNALDFAKNLEWEDVFTKAFQYV